MIFYQGCQISDIPNGLNILINLVKIYFRQGLINSLSQSIILNELNNIIGEIIIKITLEKLISKINSNKRRLQSELNNFDIINDSQENSIDLGECEIILREYYNIS